MRKKGVILKMPDNIKLSIKLDKLQAEKDLTNFINSFNNKEMKLNIDTKDIQKKLKESFNLDGVTKSAYSSAKVFENELDSIGEKIGKIHQQSDLKITTKNGLQEAKEVNKALEEQYKLQQQMSEIRSKADYNSKQREISEQNQLNKTLEEEQKLIEQIESKRQKSQSKANNRNNQDELAQAKAINKALEDNYNTSLKEADAQKKVNDKIQEQVRLLEIKKQSLARQYGDKIDTSVIDKAITSLKSMNNVSMQDLRSSISKINTEIKQSTENAKASEGILSKLGSSLGKMGIYINVGDIFRGIKSQAQEAIKYVMDVEKSMIDLRRVVDMSDTQANTFQNSMHNLSVQLASTNSDTISTVATFAKLGYSLQDATQLGEIATKYNFAADINNMNEATLSLVSTMKAYKIEAKDSAGITNDINEVSNNYAITAQDINTILQKSASTMSTFGNSLKENIALGTVANQVMQNAESVGQGLKTIGARITTNSNALDELEAMKINIEDTNGNLKSTYQIFKEMSPLIQKMKGSELARVTDNLFGKNQISTGLAIVNNIDELDKVMTTLGDTTNSVDKEFERYLDSTQAKVSQLKENMGGLYTEFLDSNMTKGTVDGLNSFVVGLTNAIRKLGTLPTVIATVVGSISLFNSKFRESMTNYQPAQITSWTNKLNVLSQTYASNRDKINKNIEAQKEQVAISNTTGMSYVTSRAKLLGYQTQLGIATVKQTACAVGAKALGLAFNMALGAGIGFAVQMISEWVNHADIAKQKNEELLATMQQTKASIDSLSELDKKFKSLSKELSSDNLGEAESLKKKKELKEVYDQLIQACPQLEGALDLENGKYEENVKLIQQAIDLKKEQLKLDTEKYLTDNDVNTKGIDEQIQKISQFKSDIEGFSKKTLFSDNDLVNSGDMTVFGKMFGSGDDRRKYFDQLKNESKQNLLDLQQSLQETLSKINSAEDLGIKLNISDGDKQKIKNALSEIDSYLKTTSNDSDDTTKQIQTLKTALEQLKIGKIDTSTIKSLNEQFPKLGITTENAKDKVEELKKILGELSPETIGELKDEFDNAEGSIKSTKEALEELTNQFNELNGSIDIIDKVIDELEKYNGQITNDTMATLLEKHPEVLQALTSEGDAISNLNKLRGEEVSKLEDVKTQAIANVLVNKNLSDSNSQLANNLTSLKTTYDDLSSKENLSSSEKTLLSSTVNSLSSSVDGLTTSIDENGNAHIDNISKVDANIKELQTEDSVIGGITNTRWDDNKACSEWQIGNTTITYEEIKKRIELYKEEIQAIKDSMLVKLQEKTNAKDMEHMSIGKAQSLTENTEENGEIEQKTKELETYEKALANIDAIYEKMGKGSSINTITAKQANDISEASKQAENDAKKAQQEAEKAQQELEKYQEQLKDTTSNIETDRYFSLNNVIDDITSSLSKLKQQQDSMTNSDYQNSLLTEIELTKKKQEAIADLKNEYANEANELRNYLSKYSFTFDSNTGDFTNSQTRLLEIQNDINSAYYEANEAGVKEKKENIEWVKQLQDKVERLASIMHTEIPKCSEDWENLAISIKKSNTSMLEDLRNNIVDNLKKDIQNQQDEWEKSNEERKTAKQDALDKKIKKLQEQLKDMEDDSIDNQTKLDKLKKSLAMYNNDDSALGKKKRKELNEQITALEKQMAKDEINNEISKLEDKKQANEDAFSEEEKLMKNKFDNMLDERELYNKADQMLVNKNITEIQNLLLRQEENFKNVGSLLGENFSEGFLREIQNGLGALDNLKAMGNGTNLYNGSYNKPFYIASSDIGGYASGGRTPSNIDNGKLSVLHSNERILNEEDTKDFDLMTKIINEDLKDFIEKSSNIFDNLNKMNFIQPNLSIGMGDLNKMANSIQNVNNDSSKVEINNEFNITNKEQVQADNMPKSIEQLMKANINRYGKRMR